MSREIVDTTNKFPNQELPDGRNCFKVVNIQKKYGKNGGEFFIWALDHANGQGEQVFLPNMMGGLLRVLKCNEIEPNKFDFDTFEQVGKFFMATVSHKPDTKDPTKIRQHMSDFNEYQDSGTPF